MRNNIQRNKFIQSFISFLYEIDIGKNRVGNRQEREAERAREMD